MRETSVSISKLFKDVRTLISTSKEKIALSVNSELVFLYWQVGDRIKKDVLNDERAEYGKHVINNLSLRLTEEFGSGWSLKQLQHCLRSAEVFSEEQITYAVRRKLTWTHLRTLFSVKDETKRLFYMEICATERWDTRTLAKKIDSLLFERSAISRKPEEIIKNELENIENTGTLTPDMIFRSTYFLDFVGLRDTYSEKDLEDAILLELQKFINELGSDFAFLSRQKRITIDEIDYHIDLLFYHRSLKRLIVIELKLGKFKPEHEGQMLLYLRWLDKYERKDGEESPIGLILCSEGNTEHVEFLMLDGGNIKVAQYLTELPDKKTLKKQLNKAIAFARQKFCEKNA
jgi:predicted nuclease of restriction endonuclease-like (RecB) superfamily